MVSRLAIDGGTPVRPSPLQGGFHGSAEIDQREIDAVLSVLRKKRLFRFLDGEKDSEAARVEAWYCERLGTKHALAVSGGTGALICALMGIDAGPGDEVIIPAYTYVATAAAVIAVGAVPVIAEVDASLNMDPVDLESKITPYTKAIIPVHMRGVSARMAEIMAVADKHRISVIEDVAQSNGGSYRGHPLGAFGRVGCFSFQQYKIITSGEGGMLVTNDDVVYERARLQHDCGLAFWSGIERGEAGAVISGENYRLSELSAGLVLAQTGRLEPLLGRFRQAKGRIVAGVQGLKGITLQDVPDPAGDCSITFTFFVPTPDLAKRFAQALNAENIRCGSIYDNQIPDRHIYSHWPFMMSGLAEDRRAPWKSPLYQGAVKGYSPTQCPRSLDYLGRAIMVFIDQFFTQDDADMVVEGIRKVASALL